MLATAPRDTDRLRILVVTDDRPTQRLVADTLTSPSLELLAATDLTDGFRKLELERFDLILLDAGMGNGAALAFLHHAATIRPDTVLVALTRAEALELGSQAVALGATRALVLPLSGDELWTVVGELRRRLSQSADLVRSEERARIAGRARHLGPALLAILDAPSRRDAAERLAVLLAQSGATRVLVYLPAAEASRQLMRLACIDTAGSSPSFCQELELFDCARRLNLDVVRLVLSRITVGFLLVGGTTEEYCGLRAALTILEPQLALSLALLNEREQTSRGAIKDPRSSAYTFAYFVDVVGREIDKARRHARHFALATLTVHFPDPDARSEGRDPASEVADRILSSVRDTDVLARVDSTEFYLLLPETGGIGAHSCRRRVMQQLLAAPPLAPSTGGNDLAVSMGVTMFPQDGTDLSQLLRLARHRAESSLSSPVRRFQLDRLPLPEILDALLWRMADTPDGLGSDAPQLLELPILELVGLVGAVVHEAVRSGTTRVVASQRTDMSIAAAVRAALVGQKDMVCLDGIDLTEHPACRDLEILVVIAEHGIYSLLGRTSQGVTRAVHTSDPLFADLLVRRLGEAVGLRLLE